jgi:hypothetical protein
MHIELIFRFFGLLLVTLYIYVKILNIKEISKAKKIAAIIFCLAVAIPLAVPAMPLYELVYLVSVCLFLKIITMEKNWWLLISAVIISTGIAVGINHVLIFALYESIPWLRGIVEITPENRWLVISSMMGVESLAIILSLMFLNFMFKTKRLRDGFVFLENKGTRLIGVLLSILIMLSRSFLGILEPNFIYGSTIVLFVTFVTVICSLGIHFWWLNHTTSFYHYRLKERTIKELLAELAEKDNQNKELAECNEFLAKAIHRDNKLIPAMYNAVLNKSPEILSELEEMIKERKEMIVAVQKEYKPLKPTGMERIDNILNYMYVRAAKKDILFELVLSEDVKDIIINTITKLELETLLADLIENAIIATSHNEGKKVLLTLGIIDDCYEIKIQDSGIPFDVETLVSLGKKKATTHASDGGSGIGYLTIFEILEACHASIIISEHRPGSYPFTKTIKIRFDEKTDYIIDSYRADEIKEEIPWTSKLSITTQTTLTATP